MPADTNRLRVDQDGLFTDIEHAVLAKWFRQRKPAAAARITFDDALASLASRSDASPTAGPPPPWRTSCLRQSRIGSRSGPAGRATS